MKKAVIFFVIAAMLLTMAGCGASSSDNTDKYSIAVTIFPEYDWIHNILGDRADRFDVALLQDS
ncbi:MAG: zinc ABC transporter substrate-binding protein, partial [Firmicutes bacterium]|nr:zinc ABC transporter substrate-binding protein [Bacillota bacterium]